MDVSEYREGGRSAPLTDEVRRAAQTKPKVVVAVVRRVVVAIGNAEVVSVVVPATATIHAPSRAQMSRLRGG